MQEVNIKTMDAMGVQRNMHLNISKTTAALIRNNLIHMKGETEGVDIRREIRVPWIMATGVFRKAMKMH